MEFNDRPAISSVWIIVGILFYPVSILLIIIRIIMHRNLSFQRIGDIKVGGYSLIGFYIFLSSIILIASWDQNTMKQYIILYIFMGIIFLLPAGYLLWLSKQKLKQLDARYIKYNEIIIKRKETSIESIAHITKRRPKMIINDVLRMMCLGLLDDGYIDESTNRIVFNKQLDLDDEKDTFADITYDRPVQLFPKTVECAGCGSSSTLKPRESIACSYCGASMVYPA